MTLDELKKETEENSNGCWIWKRSKTSAGYGQITIDKKYWTTHRLAYFLTYGDIPSKAVIRHLCHTRDCCNPAHLQEGSYKDNYNDSATTYQTAATKRRHVWEVEGIRFGTLKEASKTTGITQSSLLKYTKNGIFQTEEYRAACKVAGWLPKI